MSSRHRSRELAIQMLYQWDLDAAAITSGATIDRFWKEQAMASLDTREYFEILVRGTALHLPEIDRKIEAVSENWKMSRIDKVDLAILRVGVFEMLWHDTDIAVVIDEAIELGKKFGNAQSPTFVNGILDAIAKGSEKQSLAKKANDSE